MIVILCLCLAVGCYLLGRADERLDQREKAALDRLDGIIQRVGAQ